MHWTTRICNRLPAAEVSQVFWTESQSLLWGKGAAGLDQRKKKTAMSTIKLVA